MNGKKAQPDTEQLASLVALVTAVQPLLDLIADSVARRISATGTKLLYKREEAAEYLGVSPTTFDKYRKTWDFERVRSGRFLKFTKAGLDAWGVENAERRISLDES